MLDRAFLDRIALLSGLALALACIDGRQTYAVFWHDVTVGDNLTGVTDSILLDDSTGVFGDPFDVLPWGPPLMAWTVDSNFTLTTTINAPNMNVGDDILIGVALTSNGSRSRVENACPVTYRVIDANGDPVRPSILSTASPHTPCRGWTVLPARGGVAWVQNLSCVADNYVHSAPIVERRSANVETLDAPNVEDCLYGYDLGTGIYRIIVEYHREADRGDSSWSGWQSFSSTQVVGGRVFKADTSTVLVGRRNPLPQISSRTDDRSAATLVLSLLFQTVRRPSTDFVVAATARTDSVSITSNQHAVIALLSSGPAKAIRHAEDQWRIVKDDVLLSSRRSRPDRESRVWVMVPANGAVWTSVDLACPALTWTEVVVEDCDNLSPGHHSFVFSYMFSPRESGSPINAQANLSLEVAPSR